jgi:hypothetical protein
MDVLIALAALVDRLDPRVTALLDYFRDGRVPLRLSAAIVASALLLLLALAVWGAIAWGRIYRLRCRLRSSATVAAFARDFRQVDAALSRSIFGPAWREYRECLKPCADRVLYPRRPQEYLGLHTIDSRSFPGHFFAASHGYFIGIGLLLTFIGLVAALKFAAAGVASPDLAVAEQALNALLSAASFKFMTSIAGLGCSLLLSVAARTTTYAIEGAACGLAGDLEAVMTPLVAECLAFDQLAATRAQSVQLEQIGAFLSAVAASNGSAGHGAVARPPDTDRLEQVLTTFLGEMRASAGSEVKQLAARLSQIGDAIGQTEKHIGHSGEAFADHLSLAASRLLDAAAALQHNLDGRVAQLGGRIDALIDAVGRSEAGFAAAAKGAGDNIARGVAQATDRLVATSDAVAQRLSTAFAGLDAFNASLAPQLAGMRDIASSLATAHQALDASAETWLRSAAPVAASVEASRQVADELAEVAGRVSSVQHDLTAMAAALTRLAENTASLWDSYRGRFEKVDDDLAAVFEQLQGGTRAFGKEVMEFVGKLDGSLAKSMQALSIGTEELREVAELLVTGVQAKAA